ncbi:MAG: AAA family ATPase [Bacteroidales bacterium]|jgi:putative DNA primase/helicase|nr:AAA family ATPase [Bacteroidales bacterium]
MIEKFKNAMQSEGIIPPDSITTDGKLHRFHVQGDKIRSKNGWYILFDNEFPTGSFGCWKRGIRRTWSDRGRLPSTPAEKSRHKANIEAIRRKSEAEQRRVHSKCRKDSATIWKNAKIANNGHPYLVKKKVKSHRLKVYKGKLMLPVRDSNGKTHGLQFIGRNGKKQFKSGTHKKGNYHICGVNPVKVLYLAEGYATAASIHEATGESAVVCFDAGNLKPVAEVMRSKYPKIKIVLCADNDSNNDGKNNVGVIKATEAAQSINELIAIPQFPEDTSGSDFNDLMAVAGLDEVKLQINNAKKPEPTPDKEVSARLKVVRIDEFLSTMFPPREMLLDPWLTAQGLCMVYAPRGVGKTHFSLGVAYAVASGGEFLIWQAEKPRGVLFIDGEMQAQSLQERLSRITINSGTKTKVNLNIITPDLQPAGMLNLSDVEGQNLLLPYLDDIDLSGYAQHSS